MMRKQYLIITSDDYGYSEERDDGILRCYENGAVTSSVMMVNGQAVNSGIAKAQKVGMPLDLHLNITEGLPVGQGPYKSLVDKQGLMLGKMGFRKAHADGKIDIQEVREEIQAQIDKFESLTGHKPHKVDGHQHIHVVPGIIEVFAEVLHANSIHVTRLPIEMEVKGHSWLPCNQKRSEFLQEMVQQSCQAKEIFESNGICAPVFTGLRAMGQEMSIPHLQACILQAFNSQQPDKQANPPSTTLGSKNGVSNSSKPRLSLVLEKIRTSNIGIKNSKKLNGEMNHSAADDNFSEADDNFCAADNIFCELMVHPGKRTGNCGGCGCGPDAFSQSIDREHEMNILMSSEMKEFYKEEKINLISFEDVEVVYK